MKWHWGQRRIKHICISENTMLLFIAIKISRKQGTIFHDYTLHNYILSVRAIFAKHLESLKPNLIWDEDNIIRKIVPKS